MSSFYTVEPNNFNILVDKQPLDNSSLWKPKYNAVNTVEPGYNELDFMRYFA